MQPIYLHLRKPIKPSQRAGLFYALKIHNIIWRIIMLKGLVLTPPTLGRISIGQVIEKNGKRLPQKDDQFTITTQIQNADGWKKHPFDKQLREQQTNRKLREIPIQLMFNQPDLNLRADYCLFDRQTARPLCVGNGESCQRRHNNAIESQPCPGPDACGFAQGQCKPYGRLNVIISPDGDDDTTIDPIGSFVFRTSGFNSIRTLASRLSYFQAISQNRLASLPLALKIRGKSTRQSFGHPIYYVDLTLREGMSLEDALTQAKQTDQQRKGMGFLQNALDAAAAQGFSNGFFEDDSETVDSVLEEFYPETKIHTSDTPTTTQNLNTDLEQRLQQLNQTDSIPTAH